MSGLSRSTGYVPGGAVTYELNHPAFEPGRTGRRWAITEMFSGSRTRSRPPMNDRHLPGVGKPVRPIPAQPPQPETGGGVAVAGDTTTAPPAPAHARGAPPG